MVIVAGSQISLGEWAGRVILPVGLERLMEKEGFDWGLRDNRSLTCTGKRGISYLIDTGVAICTSG
jgi:hypothetical protein